MTDQDKENLLKAAFQARENAYAPYSRFPVGAAILSASGKIYTGCNVENSSYPAGLCAERNAVGSAVAAGERDFRAIAVIGDKEQYTMPCGICLQVLAEFHVPLILCGKTVSQYHLFTLEELLPHAFHM